MTKIGNHWHDIAAASLDVDVVRAWDGGQPLWYDLEVKPGVYDPQPMRDYIAGLRGKKMIYPIYGMPAFHAASLRRADEYGRFGGGSAPKTWTVVTPFVAWLCREFGEHIDSLQFWNERNFFEPTDDRTPEGSQNPDWQLLAIGYEAARAGLPDGVMLWAPPCLGGRPGDLAAYLKASPRPPMGVSVHFYDRSAAQLDSDLATFRAVCGDLPLAVTEFGLILEYTRGEYAQTTRWGRMTDEQRGQEFAACTRVCRKHDVYALCWYSADDGRGVVLASNSQPALSAAIRQAAADIKEDPVPTIPERPKYPSPPPDNASKDDFCLWVDRCNAMSSMYQRDLYAYDLQVTQEQRVADAQWRQDDLAARKRVADSQFAMAASNSGAVSREQMTGVFMQTFMSAGVPMDKAALQAKTAYSYFQSATKPAIQIS